MAEIGRWKGHIFEVSPALVRGFSGLSVKGSSETKDKETKKQKYVSRVSGKPMEVGMTVHLNRQLGCDVRHESTQLVEEAFSGASDYLYIADKKVVSCMLMLTEATVKEIVMAPGGTWLSADVQLTLKQAGKYGDMIGSGSDTPTQGGSGRRSRKSRKRSRSPKKVIRAAKKKSETVKKAGGGSSRKSYKAHD